MEAEKIYCEICKASIRKSDIARHKKSTKHIKNESESKNLKEQKDNLISKTKFEFPFDNIDSTDKDIFIQGKLFVAKQYTIPDCCEKLKLNLSEFKEKYFDKIKYIIDRKINTKVQFSINSQFIKSHTDEEIDIYTSTKFIRLLVKDNVDDFINEMFDVLENNQVNQDFQGSGWTFSHINYLEIKIINYKPMKGSSYIKLPKWIEDKKAVINVKNNDNKCFKWAVLSALYPANENSDRVSKYKNHENKLKFDGIDFPTPINQISKFEQQNDLAINVYYIKEINKKQTKSSVQPLKISKYIKDNNNVINLLFLEQNNNSHYCWIKNFSGLLSSQVNKDGHKKIFCYRCLSSFKNESKLEDHILYCKEHDSQLATFPSKYKNKVSFENIQRTQKCPWMIIADLECIIKKNIDNKIKPNQKFNLNDFKNYKNSKNESEHICNKTSSKTKHTHTHEACGYCYLVIFNNEIYDYKIYRGENAIEKMTTELIKTSYDLYENIPRKELVMSEKDIENFDKTTVCNMCKKDFTQSYLDDSHITMEDINKNPKAFEIDIDNTKCRDHDHFTGKYRQALCRPCNFKLKEPNFIPIYFHNLKGYDSHLIIQSYKNMDAITIIPNNSEKYISFSIRLWSPKYDCNFSLRFLDSYAFMSKSLSSLSNNLKWNQKKYLQRFFKDLPKLSKNSIKDNIFIKNLSKISNNKIKLLSKKGVYPYEYVDSFDKFDETKLPSKDEFYSFLNDSQISYKDYYHAKNVWKTFDINNLGEYHDLYLLTDVLLLTDVITNFIDVCYKNYELDPCWYYTAPSLAWDSMLKLTNIKLELITDIDKHLFLEKGIRGGLVQSITRYSKANNKDLDYFNEEIKFNNKLKSNYLKYLDANNLYGWAMSQPLPYGRFEWTNKNKVDNLNNTEDLVKYVKELNSQSKGCFLEVDLIYPSNLHDQHSDLPFCPESIKINKNKKLITTLNNKDRYVIHHKSLEQALDHGLILNKVYRILIFNQSPWLKSYIDLNTNLRSKAKNDFEKDFFKLMNNSVYGKTMENVRNRCDIKLLNIKTPKILTKLSKSTVKNIKFINDELLSIEFLKTKVELNKPIYVGASILEISKTLMYWFYYDILKKKYNNKVSLCYMDTDSFILNIETEDITKDFDEIKEHLDTSDYPKTHPLYSTVNKKVVGKFKDELNSNEMIENVNLRSKLYAFSYLNKQTIFKDKYNKLKLYHYNHNNPSENYNLSKLKENSKLYINDHDPYILTLKDIKKSKGIKRSVTNQLLIKNYKEVLFDNKPLNIQQNLIKSKNHKIYTISQDKKALDSCDDKRITLEDNIHTLPYGHYQIESLTNTNSSS